MKHNKVCCNCTEEKFERLPRKLLSLMVNPMMKTISKLPQKLHQKSEITYSKDNLFQANDFKEHYLGNFFTKYKLGKPC